MWWQSLIKLEGWESFVTIVSSDMRCWNAPEKADILVRSSFSYLLISSYYQCQEVVLYMQNVIKVSELLGSFGDNELSPECLDGAQRFLKSDGISIPSWYVYGQRKQIIQHLFCIWSLLIMFICSYTSFIQPITASKLYNDVSISKSTLLHLSCHGWVPNKIYNAVQVKTYKDIAHFETAYVVKLHRVARLAPPQPVSFLYYSFENRYSLNLLWCRGLKVFILLLSFASVSSC